MLDSTTWEAGKNMHNTKLRAAIAAIQGVVIQARMLAYSKVSPEQIADMLDQCEYLPGLLLEPDIDFNAFEQTLRDIAKRLPSCRYIAEQFATACGDADAP
jgi:hypothetical protein